MFDLTGKVAILTGGAGVLGSAMAKVQKVVDEIQEMGY